MGHSHTPKELGGARGVCGADGGFAAAAEKRVMHSSAESPVPLDSSGGAAPADGTSPAQPQVVAIRIEERTILVRGAVFALRFSTAYLSILFAGTSRPAPTLSRSTSK